MRTLIVATLSLGLGGCALFDGVFGGEEVAVAPQPAATAKAVDNPMRPEREAFRPAFASGSPVQLVPCAGKASMSDECRRLTDSHDRPKAQPTGEKELTLDGAISVGLEKQ